MNGVNRRYGNNRGFVNKSYNSFSPLMDKNIICYKCNYLGHKARDCRYMNEDVSMHGEGKRFQTMKIVE